MSDIAIRVENLTKRYRIGTSRARYKTIRESLMAALSSPFRRLKAADHKTADNMTTDRTSTGQGPVVSSQGDWIWALKDVSFEVKQGEVIGIIGRNGAGKSTLLKILSRITKPTEGRAEIHGRVGSLLEVGTGFHSELTGRENTYLNGAILGMKKEEIDRKFAEIVAFAEVEKFIDTPVKHYSSGMYVRLAFAVAAYLETETLLVDEVLAVGDAAFQNKCLGKMRTIASQGRTLLFVSHNMAAIHHLCRRAIVLSNGAVTYDGPVSGGIGSYQEEAVSVSGPRGSQLEPHPEPHVLFERTPTDHAGEAVFEITRVELRDEQGAPKPTLATWDNVTFRITCYAGSRIRSGSAVLQICTPLDVSLVLTSTQPDSTIPFAIEPGLSTVECQFDSFPLAAGEYTISIGLAIPNKEWLCWRERLGVLRVQPRDVYGSGLAPVSPRSLVAIPHRWRVV
jgi:lipopolysaccharide transport system ATP-binding protein